MKKYKALFIIGVLFLMGCTTTEFVQSDLAKTYSKRTSHEQIKVYRSERPQGKYIEIGTVHSAGGDSLSQFSRIRKKASEIGGDGLIGLEPYIGGVSATVIRFE